VCAVKIITGRVGTFYSYKAAVAPDSVARNKNTTIDCCHCSGRPMCARIYTRACGFQRDSASYTRFPSVTFEISHSRSNRPRWARACHAILLFRFVWRWRTLETCTDLREPVTRDNRVLKSHSNTVGHWSRARPVSLYRRLLFVSCQSSVARYSVFNMVKRWVFDFCCCCSLLIVSARSSKW